MTDRSSNIVVILILMLLVPLTTPLTMAVGHGDMGDGDLAQGRPTSRAGQMFWIDHFDNVSFIYSLGSQLMRSRSSILIEPPNMGLRDDPWTLALFHMDEGSGPYLINAGHIYGSEYNATVNEATWVPGLSGTGLSFDGINDYASFVDNHVDVHNDSFSVEFFISAAPTIGSPATGPVIAQGSGTPQDVGNGTFNLTFAHQAVPPLSEVQFNTTHISGTKVEGLYGNNSYYNDTWKYVACVFDHGSKYIYLNGVLIASGSTNNGTLAFLNTTTYIGVNDNPLLPGTMRFFNGTIDEIRLSTVGREASEILSTMENDVSYNASNLTFQSTRINIPNLSLMWDNLTVTKEEFPGSDVRVSVLDPDTQVPLGTHINETGTLIGLQDIDTAEHPSLMLRAWFTTDGLNSSILDAWNVSWRPTTGPTNFSLSGPDTVRRDEQVEYVALMEDVDDPVGSLNVSIDHMVPGVTGYENSSIKNLHFDAIAGKWRFTFAPNATAPLGNYTIRMNASDPSGRNGTGILSARIKVVEERTPHVTLSVDTPVIKRTATASLTLNTTELEGVPSAYTVYVGYRGPADADWRTSYVGVPRFTGQLWKADFTPAKDAAVGAYDFNVSVRDTEGNVANNITTGGLVQVQNNPPTWALGALDVVIAKGQAMTPIEIFRFTGNVTDVETSVSDLRLGLAFYSNATKWQVYIDVMAQAVFARTLDIEEDGWCDIDIQASDGLNTSTLRIALRVGSPGSGLFGWMDPMPSLTLQEDNPTGPVAELREFVLGADDKDAVTFTYLQNSNSSFIRFGIASGSHGLDLKYMQANWTGTCSVSMRATYSGKAVDGALEVVVTPLNDAPAQKAPIPTQFITAGVPVSLKIGDYFEDPDDPTSSLMVTTDSLFVFQVGDQLLINFSIPGTVVNVTLWVSDPWGEQCTASIHLEVAVAPDDGGGNDDEGWSLFGIDRWTWMLVLLIIMVMAIAATAGAAVHYARRSTPTMEELGRREMREEKGMVRSQWEEGRGRAQGREQGREGGPPRDGRRDMARGRTPGPGRDGAGGGGEGRDRGARGTDMDFWTGRDRQVEEGRAGAGRDGPEQTGPGREGRGGPQSRPAPPMPQQRPPQARGYGPAGYDGRAQGQRQGREQVQGPPRRGPPPPPQGRRGPPPSAPQAGPARARGGAAGRNEPEGNDGDFEVVDMDG